MSILTFVFVFFVPAFAQTDFSIAIELDEPIAISSTLTLKGKTCVGRNQKKEIKHATQVCQRISREYKMLFGKAPDTLPPASDEPTALIRFSNGNRKWDRIIGRVSGDTPENMKLKSLTNEILKLNAK